MTTLKIQRLKDLKLSLNNAVSGKKKVFLFSKHISEEIASQKKNLLFFHYYIYIEPESACLQISNLIRNSMHKAKGRFFCREWVSYILVSLLEFSSF